jgi:tetratricopeptide (TPR) repeat protein
LISYAWHQFGDRIPGKAYREMVNGERINNWNVEIKVLLPIHDRLNISYERNESLSTIDIDNISFPYLEKMLELLRPWSVNFDMDSTDRIDNLDEFQIALLLYIFSEIERQIAMIHMRRNQLDQAENHCQQALSYARLYEGNEETKIDLLCTALRSYTSVHTAQGRDADAIIYAEEAYNCVAVAYNPVHPKVQTAAGTLIESLIHTGDLFNAERFAQATLDSLKDPANGLDQESIEVAKGYYDLANVICQQKGDLVKAEMLVRESLRIRSQLHCHDHQMVGSCVILLAGILRSQGKLDYETKELFERSLTIYIKQCGPDGKNTAVANLNMGNYYRDLARIQQDAGKKCPTFVYIYLITRKQCEFTHRYLVLITRKRWMFRLLY